MEAVHNKNIKIVLSILEDEARGNLASAFSKLADGYSMTWVYKTPKNGKIFPVARATDASFEKEMKEAYSMDGRQYAVKNVCAGNDVVMVELVESYRDPMRAKTFRTPLVLVLEMKDGKILRGRHYCDPNISHLGLSEHQIECIYNY